MANDTETSLEYSRFLYDNVKDWYKNADTKAQILLTLMGAFVDTLTKFVFGQKVHNLTED